MNKTPFLKTVSAYIELSYVLGDLMTMASWYKKNTGEIPAKVWKRILSVSQQLEELTDLAEEQRMKFEKKKST